MFDPKLYREACRELRAPEDKIEEIIAMTEKTNQKRIRPLRTALICAAALAMMVVSVAAANPEGFQEFVFEIMSSVQVDDYRTDITTTSGEQVTVFSIPEAEVQLRDGRAVLILNGEEKADVTDALSKTGRYDYQETSGDTELSAVVEGTAEDWTIQLKVNSSGEDSLAYTFTRDEEGNVIARADIPDNDGETYTWTSISADNGSYVSSFTSDGETAALIPAGK